MLLSKESSDDSDLTDFARWSSSTHQLFDFINGLTSFLTIKISMSDWKVSNYMWILPGSVSVPKNAQQKYKFGYCSLYLSKDIQ